MTSRRAPALLACVLALAASVAACTREADTPKGTAPAAKPTATCEGPPPNPEPDTNAKLAAYTDPMVIVQPTKMEAELKEVGLDVKKLPPFAELDRKQKGVVMKTFAASLGLRCIGCHDVDDFKKPSPRKKATVRMWNEFVRVLQMDDGSPIYCDSCHQGSVQVIDRRNKGHVASFMDDILVGKMKRADGKDHDCGTCHGDPPEFSFLKDWRGEGK